MNQTSPSFAGWVSSPSTRGSIDIVFSSFLAIFLCTRSSLWRSVQRFRELGYPHWTLRHGFFADMGGMLLLPEGDVPFVINSSQVAFLVEKGYMECPKITAEEIWDKSKADFVSKSFAFLQASWFLFQLLGRAIVPLPTTALEIFTGAIVFCSFGNFVCWLHKPNDIRKSITLKINVSLQQVVSGGEAAAAVFHQHTDNMDEKPSKYATMAKAFGLSLGGRGRGRPLVRIPNSTFPELTVSHKVAFFCLGKVYAAFHLAAWNAHFPTNFELLGWRIAILIFPPDENTWSKYLKLLPRQKLSTQQAFRKEDDGESAVSQAHKNCRRVQRENFGLCFHPVYRVVIRATLVPLYVISRLFLVVGALSSLRS
ncbi:hypothetical protein F4824DRAFT_486185 [Ustulina deusta]|nr:hypothetical protein F4824DRAFT_486185 [Ustulina deusta]